MASKAGTLVLSLRGTAAAVNLARQLAKDEELHQHDLSACSHASCLYPTTPLAFIAAISEAA